MNREAEVRRDRLAQLIKKYGSQAALADEVNKGLDAEEKPLAPSQFSQVLGKKKRAIGEKICRKIERGLNLPYRWMDITDESQELIDLIIQLPDRRKNFYIGMIKDDLDIKQNQSSENAA